MNLYEKMNVSKSKDHDSAIRIDPKKDISYHETLCLYCADNDINTNDIDDDDFDASVELLQSWSKHNDKEQFYFWVE